MSKIKPIGSRYVTMDDRWAAAQREIEARERIGRQRQLPATPQPTLPTDPARAWRPHDPALAGRPPQLSHAPVAAASADATDKLPRFLQQRATEPDEAMPVARGSRKAARRR